MTGTKKPAVNWKRKFMRICKENKISVEEVTTTDVLLLAEKVWVVTAHPGGEDSRWLSIDICFGWAWACSNLETYIECGFNDFTQEEMLNNGLGV